MNIDNGFKEQSNSKEKKSEFIKEPKTEDLVNKYEKIYPRLFVSFKNIKDNHDIQNLNNQSLISVDNLNNKDNKGIIFNGEVSEIANDQNQILQNNLQSSNLVEDPIITKEEYRQMYKDDISLFANAMFDDVDSGLAAEQKLSTNSALYLNEYLVKKIVAFYDKSVSSGESSDIMAQNFCKQNVHLVKKMNNSNEVLTTVFANLKEMLGNEPVSKNVLHRKSHFQDLVSQGNNESMGILK